MRVSPLRAASFSSRGFDRPPELLDLVLAGLDAEWRRRKVQCEEELEAAERAATS